MITKRPFVSATVKDGSQSYSKMRLSVKDDISETQALDGVEALLSPLSGVSGCVPVRISVTYGFVNDTATNAAVGSNVGLVALMVFDTSTPGQYAMIQIPGIRQDCILDDSSVNSGLVIDTHHPDIVNFVNLITSGLFCNVFGYDIQNLVGTIIERRL